MSPANRTKKTASVPSLDKEATAAPRRAVPELARGLVARHFPLVPEVYPDEHAFEIRNQFARSAPGGARVELQPRKVVFICFTNRCGSNFLAQAIASDGQLRQADEFMCWDVVRKHADQHGLRSLEEYLNWLGEDQAGRSGYFACKVSLSQLLLLYEEGVLDRWAPSAKFIHVYREDVLAQAASLNVAWHTKRWTSEDAGVDAQVPWEPTQMFGIARSIALRNAYFPLVFELMGIEPLRVRYEDFVADPALGTRKIGDFLELPTLSYTPERVSYRKQAGPSNDDLVARLKGHFQLTTPEPPPAAPAKRTVRSHARGQVEDGIDQQKIAASRGKTAASTAAKPCRPAAANKRRKRSGDRRL